MINSGREWDWMDSQINKLKQMKIRTEIDNVKQQLIDDLNNITKIYFKDGE